MQPSRQYPGQVEISFTFTRHLGPRLEHGSVRIRFDSLQPYAFSSSAVWPDIINYEAEVKAGVEKALREIQGSLQITSVKLLAIEFDIINSTPHGFESAAYAATCAAFFS